MQIHFHNDEGKLMLSKIAKDFVETKFAKIDGVLGVVLVGSSSLGYIDDLSDIDLEVIATDELFRRVGGTHEGYEQYRGVSISWEWLTFKEFEKQFGNWEDDIDLWVYSKSQILHDHEHKLGDFLAEYKRHPKDVWLKKLFLYWYFATGNAPYDSGKAIQRNDFVTAQLYLTQAMEYYTALVFLLNHSFVPYRKWRLKEFDKLAYKPHGFREKLHAILTTADWSKQEFETKQALINDLVISLKNELLKAGVSKERIEDPWKFKVNYVPRT